MRKTRAHSLNKYGEISNIVLINPEDLKTGHRGEHDVGTDIIAVQYKCMERSETIERT